VHDLKRLTFQGNPTHAAVENAIRLLQKRNIRMGVLAVCNPEYRAREFCEYFAGLGLQHFDILIPDATFDDTPSSVGRFYCHLFDWWLEANRDQQKISIRKIESTAAGLLGGRTTTEAIGYGPQRTCTILTDGSMEPLDVLRIAGDGSTKTKFNIFDNTLDEMRYESLWRAAFDASLELNAKCKDCKFMHACGGGYLPHRYSRKNGYDNPSIYCDDLLQIFTHMQTVLQRHVYIAKQGADPINLSAAASTRASGGVLSDDLDQLPSLQSCNDTNRNPFANVQCNYLASSFAIDSSTPSSKTASYLSNRST
jgi:uncharacterized protein